MPAGHRLSVSSRRRRSTAASTNIPAQLQNSVPTCARPCLSAYINGEYDCAANDAACLCSQYSTEGFTLGEIAYVCTVLNCSDAPGQSREAYNMCFNEAHAAQPTHSTLTLPTTSPTEATATTSSYPITSTNTSGHATMTSSAHGSATDTATMQTVTSSTAPTSSPAAEETSAKLKGSTGLTSGQAIGISIAAVGLVAMILAGVLIYRYMRRRKRNGNERRSYDFIDESPPRFPPFDPGHSTPGALGGCYVPRAQFLPEKRMTDWSARQPQTQPQWPSHENYSSAAVYESEWDTPKSRGSDTSTRTVSQLLPDRPQVIAFPPPRKSSYQNAVGPHTPATVFEEERPPTHPSALLPGLPAHPAVLKTRQASSVTCSRTMKSPEHPRRPSISVEIPIQAPRKVFRVVDSVPLPPPSCVPKQSKSDNCPSGRSNPADALPLPLPPPVLTRLEPDSRLSERSGVSNAQSSVLDYYAAADSGSPQDLYSSTPIEEETQVRRAAPAAIMVTKPIAPPRAVRASMASDTSRRTSFESTDPDEPTPPEEEDKRLTPVAESPIAGIRYPKIPRSSNQSVPRSPVARQSPPEQSSQFFTANRYKPGQAKQDSGHIENRTSSLSGGTLAAKRRGDGAAQDLERSLHLARKNVGVNDNSFTKAGSPQQQRQIGPLKGYGRVASQARPPQSPHSQQQPAFPLTIEMKSPPGSAALKSPLWEPKLTPSRKGDDLYLRVDVATPRDANFQFRTG